MWISIYKISIQFLSEPDKIDIDANDNKNFVFKLEIWFIHSWDHPAVFIRWKKIKSKKNGQTTSASKTFQIGLS